MPDALNDTEDPTISIKGYLEGNIVKIEFIDNGSGMKEEQLDYIFEPFYTTKENGNGVGMFIVKKLIEENGGTIQARPNVGNKGFGVYLKVMRGVSI